MTAGAFGTWQHGRQTDKYLIFFGWVRARIFDLLVTTTGLSTPRLPTCSTYIWPSWGWCSTNFGVLYGCSEFILTHLEILQASGKEVSTSDDKATRMALVYRCSLHTIACTRFRNVLHFTQKGYRQPPREVGKWLGWAHSLAHVLLSVVRKRT